MRLCRPWIALLGGLLVSCGVILTVRQVAADSGPSRFLQGSISTEVTGDPDVPINPRPTIAEGMSGEPEPGPVPVKLWQPNGQLGRSPGVVHLGVLVGLIGARIAIRAAGHY
jgi:hypothetical protein